jgi:hypothetical protein
MRLHIDALFTHDERGRLLRVNEPGGGEAPRFFLGKTAEGVEWRVRFDVDDDLVLALESAVLADHVADHVDDSARYERLLARAAPVRRTWAGPAFHFPAELPRPTDVVLVTAANAGLLHPHLAVWAGDVATCQPMFVRVVGGHAVSVCASVRTTPAADEAGVETAAAFRGYGYAGAAVAAWAGAVRALGRIPLYSTSWDNAGSQAVARKLGLLRYGTDLHIT